jgi:hypothetical protein
MRARFGRQMRARFGRQAWQSQALCTLGFGVGGWVGRRGGAAPVCCVLCVERCCCRVAVVAAAWHRWARHRSRSNRRGRLAPGSSHRRARERESFMRVHWVAVPEALRARRVNRARQKKTRPGTTAAGDSPAAAGSSGRKATASRRARRQPPAQPLGSAAVSRPFPSWNRSILAEIYLCHACSNHDIEDGHGRAGARAGGAPAMAAPPPRWTCRTPGELRSQVLEVD